MRKSLLFSILGLIVFSGIAGCSGGNGMNNVVSLALDHNTAQVLDEGQAMNFTATVMHDPNNKGVNWTVACQGGGNACGQLAQAATPSGTANAFTAPAAVPSGTTAVATITATAVADNSKQQMVMVTSYPKPAAKNPPPPPPGPATVGQPFSVMLMDFVQDGGAPPAHWSLAANSPANPGAFGLSLNANTGELSGTPTKPTVAAPKPIVQPQAVTTKVFIFVCTDSGNPPQTVEVTVSITINPAPLAITTTTVPNGAVGAAYGPATLSATGGVTPFTWSWAAQAGSTLPPGLKIATNADNTGTISGTPITAGTFKVTVTVTAADPGVAHMNFTIIIAAPGKLTITTSSLPSGTVGINYGSGGNGAVLNASGGLTPFVWSWAPQGGSTRAGLPPGLNISTNSSDNTGLISGMPSQLGVFDVTVFVSDAEAPAVQVAANFTITITAQSACTASGTTLCGQFTFLAQGAKGNTESPVMIAGTFLADGNGHVTSGSLDRNNASGTGALFNKLITGGTFTVGGDGRGSVTLTTTGVAGAVNITFAFALNSSGTIGFLIESDDLAGTGDHLSGFMQAADSSKFTAASITGGYAMGLLGGTSAASRPRAVMIAAVSASGADCGLTSNGSSVFINYNAGTVTPNLLPFTCGNGGLSTVDAATGRGTVSIVLSGGPFSTQTLNFAFYIIDANTVILISTDSAGANLPILSGTLQHQQASTFSAAALTCTSNELIPTRACIFALSGESGSGSHVAVGRAVPEQASGKLDVTTDDNKAGAVNSQTTLGWTVSVSANGMGMLTPPAGSNASSANVVLIEGNDAVLALVDGSVSFGFIRPQKAFVPSATPGTFFIGTQFIANGSVPNVSGKITPTGPTNNMGTLSGTLDVEQILIPPPAPVEITGAAITGNYTLAATGRATGGSTQPGPSSFIIYNVSGTEILLMESDATSPQPVLIDMRHF